MKPLKRLWDATGTPSAFFAMMTLSLAVQGWVWHAFTQHHDLNQLTSTAAYHFGILSTTTAATAGAAVGGALSLLARRYRGRPMDVDPDYPPNKMIYLQGEGELGRCACHDRVIEDGTEIWYWPQPAKLVCIRKGHSR